MDRDKPHRVVDRPGCSVVRPRTVEGCAATVIEGSHAGPSKDEEMARVEPFDGIELEVGTLWADVTGQSVTTFVETPRMPERLRPPSVGRVLDMAEKQDGSGRDIDYG